MVLVWNKLIQHIYSWHTKHYCKRSYPVKIDVYVGKRHFLMNERCTFQCRKEAFINWLDHRVKEKTVQYKTDLNQK